MKMDLNYEAAEMHAVRKNRPKDVRIGRTRVGKGVFSRQHYRADAVVGKILGDVIDDAHYGSDYCMHIGDGCQLEPSAPFRFLNHSCDPNCRYDWIEVAGRDAQPDSKEVFLIAMRDIKPGEELTIEYNWPAEGAIPCRCQSPMCRGWIVDEEDLDALRKLVADRQ